MTKRKTFSKEFKIEAVRQLELGDKSPNEIAVDLGKLKGTEALLSH